MNARQRRKLRRAAARVLRDIRPDIEVTDDLAFDLLIQARRTRWEMRGGRLHRFKTKHEDGLSRRGRQILHAINKRNERRRS